MPLSPDQAIRGVIEAKKFKGLIKTKEEEDREWDRLYEIWAEHNPEPPTSSPKTASSHSKT